MRVLFSVSLLIVAASAYDAVLFSNQREIGGISAEQLVKAATPEEPIVFIVNPDFTLGQFSVKANAYSAEPTTDYMAKSVKNSNYHESQYFPNQIDASTAQVLTSADQFKSGASIYILAGEEWTSMEQLAESLISKIDNSVGVLTATDAVYHEKTNRVKRVATDEMDAASDSSSASSDSPTDLSPPMPFPMILPPYNSTVVNVQPVANNTCLFYLEGLTVVVQQTNDKVVNFAAASLIGQNLTYRYAKGDADCATQPVGSFLFRLRLELTTDVAGKQRDTVAFKMAAGEKLDVTLNITGDIMGYWKLSGATLHSASITGEGTYKSAKVQEQKIGEIETQYSKINSVAGWSLVCGQSQAVFFPTDTETVKIGIALLNTQIQTFNVARQERFMKSPYFTLQAEDCTGTFSAGSWMGIISALVLIGGLLFGYVMLQSVQTMDRFDDPKQKQIVINVRE